MAENIPDGITAEDVKKAIQDFKSGVPHDFGRSTFYDLIFQGERFPPKAILGLAARRVNGGEPLGPYDFSGGEKSRCFRVLRNLGFEVGPKPDQPSPGHNSPIANQTDWTDEELQAAVMAYIDMLARERSGHRVNKAEENRKLRAGPLSGRTQGSVEFRMQNISHVLHARGLSWIEGYKPARHTGAVIQQRIETLLTGLGYLDTQDFEPTTDPDDLEKRSSRLLNAGLSEKPKGETNPKASTTSTTTYVRDPGVKAWVLQEAFTGWRLEVTSRRRG
jgi:hypothetical protein